MATYADLATLLWRIEKTALHLKGLHKANGDDPIFWKRIGSTRFAAEKQRKTLMIEAKLKGLSEPKAPTLPYSRASYMELAKLCTEASTMADQTEGDAQARASAISTSMAKQASLTETFADAIFAEKKPAKKEGKAKKTA